MFTPPNGGSSSSTPPQRFSPGIPPRRRLPPRSSLSNSFSFAPIVNPLSAENNGEVEEEEIMPESNSTYFNFLPPPAPQRMTSSASAWTPLSPAAIRISNQGDSGIASISPRGKPAKRFKMASNGNGNGKGKGSDRNGRGEEEDEEEEEEEGMDWDMVDSMRLWRHDAIMQHLYETAAMWGDKILAWTADPNDAFWLAQTHFLTGQYLRAERLLMGVLPSLPSSSVTGWKGKQRSTDFNQNQEGRDGENGFSDNGATGRLVDDSLPCRYLAAQCMVHQEKFHEALELLGESNPFKTTTAKIAETSSGGAIKLHSSICLLRGSLHSRLSSMDLAKESFMEALILDVRNYDAFRELVEGGMMTSGEEWEFITNLAYSSQLSAEEAKFVKLMYITKLKKDSGPKVQEITQARNQLITKYNLSNNPDVLVGQADELYSQYKWEDCYVITTRILEMIPNHQSALTLHLACMHHIHRLRNSLFILAHDLVQQDPASATTWYAVGLWYFSGKRWGEARRYFSKANLVDSRFAPAWIAFAHSFAYEGEHNQAITSYSTSSRLFPGSHLPLLFIGMEHLQLSENNLAEEYFKASQALHAHDPLLLNELGVVAYNKDDYITAVKYFRSAIKNGREMQGVMSIWAGTHCNLGHAYRLMGNYDEAEKAYLSSIRLDPINPTPYASLAMISHLRGDIRGAIQLYHRALSLNPQDPINTVLLEMALKAQAETLSPLTIPGLPEALTREDFDPFTVPKGNNIFGTVPIENDPISLEEAGHSGPSGSYPGVGHAGGSGRGRSSNVGGGGEGFVYYGTGSGSGDASMGWSGAGDDGEKTMDIED